MSTTFQWFGDKILSLIGQNIDARMVRAGEAGVAEAQRLVPVDTGQTKASIGYTYNAQTKTLQLHADTTWAVFVEMGTRFRRAQPFLRPGLAAAAKVFGGGDITLETQLLNAPAKYTSGKSRGYHHSFAKYRAHGKRGVHTHTFNFGQRHRRTP